MNGTDPIVVGYGGTAELERGCDCCTGTALETPGRIHNRPGLPEVHYRVGTHADFKRSMLARLSAEQHPALGRLKVRSDDDFSIALFDAWATVCDVLTFYIQYYANEGTLITAKERASILELARLIGYRLAPGVAAATDLVFTLEEPPGAPDRAVTKTTIPVGTRVQSVPGPDETAQTFETVETLNARLAFNAMAPRRTRLVLPAFGDTRTYLQGTSTGLKVGDAIVLVGNERVDDATSERWDFRRLVRVEPDAAHSRTYVEWTPGLGSASPHVEPASEDVKIFALRKRASLFGYNAPHRKLFKSDTLPPGGEASSGDWAFTIDATAKQLLLDALYPDLVPQGFIALANSASYVELYRIEEVAESGWSQYGVSGRATELTLDTSENLWRFDGSEYRKTTVFCQSEPLEFAETPIDQPVWGDSVECATLLDDLEPGRRLIVRGRRAAVECRKSIELESSSDPGTKETVPKGTTLWVLSKFVEVTPLEKRWTLRAPGGFEGNVVTSDETFRFVAAPKDSEIVAEPVTLDETERTDPTHSRLKFTAALERAFDRATTVIHGNVAPATHGESKDAIIGSGDSSRPFQSFVLSESPLTHVSANTGTGVRSTLEVRVDDVLWTEVPFLYGRKANERVYSTHITNDGATVVRFGDGVRGARPSSGQNNIVASYRVGLGRQGSVAARSLETPLDKPLGMKAVFNPLPAAGGDDPERLEDARDNAPVTTLTLGRVVSLQDYENFARAFAGVAKAQASWVWDGDTRRILVTVAGPAGAAIEPDVGTTHGDLLDALRDRGDPFVRVDVASYRPVAFKVALRIKVERNFDVGEVLGNVETSLRRAYGFEARGFARLIALSAIVTEVHRVPGVVAVDVDKLYRTVAPSAAPIRHARLLAQPPVLTPAGEMIPAEILTLDPGPLDLEEMP